MRKSHNNGETIKLARQRASELMGTFADAPEWRDGATILGLVSRLETAEARLLRAQSHIARAERRINELTSSGTTDVLVARSRRGAR